MSEPKTVAIPETGTLERLLEEFRELNKQVDANLAKLSASARLSPAYHDALAALYAHLTLTKCLAEELQAEMNRLDDQLPGD